LLSLPCLMASLHPSLPSLPSLPQMFSNVVLGVKMENFDHILSTFKAEKKYTQDTDMTAEDWKAIVKLYQKVTHVPSDPHEQLQLAIRAVFSSWMTPRAIKYRQYNDIPDTLGTGVTVQVREGGRKRGRGAAF
jgi:pyruvate, orthophosphate dikinase